MRPLLYLVHRIPYPPNKGDKVRSFNLLKSLSNKYDVHLGAFVDSSDDWQYAEKLNKYCKQVKLEKLRPGLSKLKSLKGFFTGDALSVQYYKSYSFQKWVNETIENYDIEHVVVYSSTMAQYVSGDSKEKIHRRVADFVDVDSDKWRQYSMNKNPPMSWVYQREARKLLEYEQNIAKTFNATLFVSKAEMLDFNKISPASNHQHGFYNNGVDTEYFDPALNHINPYEPGVEPIVFTGAMNYWANIDAVTWFAKQIFPGIKKNYPNVRFYIVGISPADEVRKLEKNPDIIVTGKVDDIRPYIRHASIIVAPLRIARGIQNKVLEAMAMSRPIVATKSALDGISLCENYAPYCANDESDFIDKCTYILKQPIEQRMVTEARKCLLDNYNWDKNLQVLDGYLN